MVKEYSIKDKYLVFGISWTAFGLGFHISKYQVSLDIGWFWLILEL